MSEREGLVQIAALILCTAFLRLLQRKEVKSIGLYGGLKGKPHFQI
ncbi:hypothetical protein CsSME_00037200 [Camellia sinensis var. sinensis]